MCLAVPAKIVEIEGQLVTVEVGGLTRQASIVLLPDASLGDYVLIHAGFAISRIDEKEALETLHLFEQLGNGDYGSISGPQD
ncbi:MAG: HypC/HybG/HupF family hydrogenase formation chaperone [Thermoleophilia bacterium]